MYRFRLFVVLGLAACNSAPPEPAAGCNPLVGDDCITPFPSSFWQRASSSTATGVQVHLPDGVLPRSADGIPYSPARLNREDGFSPATAGWIPRRCRRATTRRRP